MKIAGGVVGLWMVSLLSGQAAMILTVEKMPTGGVSVTASGTIEIQADWHWAYDYELDIGQTPRWRPQSFISGNKIGALGEAWRGLDGAYTPPASMITYRTYDLGSLGRGLFLSRDGFNLVDAGASDNNREPNETTFAFDFVLYDRNGMLSQYTDGQVLWDSNGVAEGGQTVTWRVIPEPSSMALLVLFAPAPLLRRRRLLS